MNPFSAAARVGGTAALLALSGCYYVGPGYYPYGSYGSYGSYGYYPTVPADATQRSVAVAPYGPADNTSGAPPSPGNPTAQQAQAAPAPSAAYAVPAPAPVYVAPAYYPPYPAYYPAYPAYYGWPGWWGPSVSLRFGYWGGGHGHHH